MRRAACNFIFSNFLESTVREECIDFTMLIFFFFCQLFRKLLRTYLCIKNTSTDTDKLFCLKHFWECLVISKVMIQICREKSKISKRLQVSNLKFPHVLGKGELTYKRNRIPIEQFPSDL